MLETFRRYLTEMAFVFGALGLLLPTTLILPLVFMFLEMGLSGLVFVVAVAIIFGYPIGCLWTLLVIHRKRRLTELSIKMRIGLSLGFIAGAILMGSAGGREASLQMLEGLLFTGLGPIILLSALLLRMLFREEISNYHDLLSATAAQRILAWIGPAVLLGLGAGALYLHLYINVLN